MCIHFAGSVKSIYKKQIFLTLSKFHFTIEMNISLYESVHNFNSFSFSILKFILNKICNLCISFARYVFREIKYLFHLTRSSW